MVEVFLGVYLLNIDVEFGLEQIHYLFNTVLRGRIHLQNTSRTPGSLFSFGLPPFDDSLVCRLCGNVLLTCCSAGLMHCQA